MIRTRPSTPHDRGAVTLSDDFLVRRWRDHWAVVGPTGLFVVGRSDGDPADAGQRTAVAAHALRTRLAEEVPWVPFVDPVLVVEEPAEPHGGACTEVAVEDLEALLTDGPDVLDRACLHQLRTHLPGVVQTLELEPERYPA